MILKVSGSKSTGKICKFCDGLLLMTSATRDLVIRRDHTRELRNRRVYGNDFNDIEYRPSRILCLQGVDSVEVI